MMGWFSRLFSGGAKPATSAVRTEPQQQPTEAVLVPVDDVAQESAPEAEVIPTLPWLLDCAPLTESALTEAERDALHALSKTLALPTVPDNLLPRAASLIPQLIALVRQTDLPTPAIAERIGKDAGLTAEVLRLASSP